MKRAVQLCVAGLSTLVALGPALADPAARRPSAEKISAFMRVYGPAQPPYGFVRYCEARPEACGSQGFQDTRFSPTAERLSELDEINRAVNRAVLPATDAEIYGISEYWTLPSERGDCEDYALLKQKMLAQRGWPSSSLLLTVVRDEKGEGHAVLTARTAQGDFILDNKIDDVKVWNKTPYMFVMRQSYVDPRVWVSLDSSDERAPASIAGTQSPGRTK